MPDGLRRIPFTLPVDHALFEDVVRFWHWRTVGRAQGPVPDVSPLAPVILDSALSKWASEHEHLRNTEAEIQVRIVCSKDPHPESHRIPGVWLGGEPVFGRTRSS